MNRYEHANLRGYINLPHFTGLLYFTGCGSPFPLLAHVHAKDTIARTV
jgi:hypothetical protein